MLGRMEGLWGNEMISFKDPYDRPTAAIPNPR